MVYAPGYGPVYPRRIESDTPRVIQWTVRMIDEAGDEHLVTVRARSREVAISRARCQCPGRHEVFVLDAWRV